MGLAVVTFHEGALATKDELGLIPRLNETRSEVLQTGIKSVATKHKAFASQTVSFPDTTQDGGYATVTVLDGNIWVLSGRNPVAQPPGPSKPRQGFLLVNGTTRTFSVAAGEFIAAIDFNALTLSDDDFPGVEPIPDDEDIVITIPAAVMMGHLSPTAYPVTFTIPSTGGGTKPSPDNDNFGIGVMHGMLHPETYGKAL